MRAKSEKDLCSPISLHRYSKNRGGFTMASVTHVNNKVLFNQQTENTIKNVSIENLSVLQKDKTMETPAYIVELLSCFGNGISSTNTVGTIDTGRVKTFADSGDSLMGHLFSSLRGYAELGRPISDEGKAVLDEYCNLAEEIEKGGEKTLLAYNLMFAGMAAYANEDNNDGWARKYIMENGYEEETYNNIKKFAAELQDKSNVYVSLDFGYLDYEDIDEANSIKYSYMGAMCSIGVQALDFMAEHREADDVWVNVAQGKYKNQEELLQGLRDGGHDGVADAYAKQILGVEEEDKEELSQWEFASENGALWNVTIGHRKPREEKPRQKFEDLKLKYFGDADARVTYTKEQLRQAYKEGSKKAEKFIWQSSKGYAAPAEEDTKSAELDRKRKQIQSLRKQLMELNREIRDLKSSMLAEENKSEKIKQIQQRQQTIQIQIEDVLNSMIDK